LAVRGKKEFNVNLKERRFHQNSARSPGWAPPPRERKREEREKSVPDSMGKKGKKKKTLIINLQPLSEGKGDQTEERKIALEERRKEKSSQRSP